MGLNCKFIMPNEEFSQKYADENNDGEESGDNYKVLWEDEINVDVDLSDFKIEETGDYSVSGEKDGTAFSISVPKMRKLVFNDENHTTIAVSESVLENFDFDEKKQTLSVLFREKSVITNVIPGIYINVSEFPKELK